jgi:hypothetical protein
VVLLKVVIKSREGEEDRKSEYLQESLESGYAA